MWESRVDWIPESRPVAKSIMMTQLYRHSGELSSAVHIVFNHIHSLILAGIYLNGLDITATHIYSISKLARLQPQSAGLNLIDHGLQVHLGVRLIPASECGSKLTRSRPGSVPLSSQNHGLQLHLQTRLIMASEWIPQSRSPIASPNSLNHGLPVHLWVHLISISNCISKLTRSHH